MLKKHDQGGYDHIEGVPRGNDDLYEEACMHPRSVARGCRNVFQGVHGKPDRVQYHVS